MAQKTMEFLTDDGGAKVMLVTCAAASVKRRSTTKHGKMLGDGVSIQVGLTFSEHHVPRE